jgi:hypothetical protein
MSIPSILSVAGRAGAKSVPRFLAVACAAALLFSAVDGRAATVNAVGNVLTFSTGSTAGNPQGSWTYSDKMWSYIQSSGFVLSGTGGQENIQIINGLTNNAHSFDISQLGGSGFNGPGTWMVGYKLAVIPLSPYVINSFELDSTHINNTVSVYKDVFSSLSLFNTGSGSTGGGDLVALTSINGTTSPIVAFPGVSEVWVRDTIVIGAGGNLLSANNIVTQSLVPEIDVASIAGVFPLLIAGLALLERRRGARAGRTSPAAG